MSPVPEEVANATTFNNPLHGEGTGRKFSMVQLTGFEPMTLQTRGLCLKTWYSSLFPCLHPSHHNCRNIKWNLKWLTLIYLGRYCNLKNFPFTKSIESTEGHLRRCKNSLKRHQRCQMEKMAYSMGWNWAWKDLWPSHLPLEVHEEQVNYTHGIGLQGHKNGRNTWPLRHTMHGKSLIEW